MPTLRQLIQIDQQQAGEEKRLAWWKLLDTLGKEGFSHVHFVVTGFHDPSRLLVGIHERIHFWRDERQKDRYEEVLKRDA